MPKKRVTEWVVKDAERECERRDGHFERARGEIYIVWGDEDDSEGGYGVNDSASRKEDD